MSENGMKNMTIENIAAACDGSYFGNQELLQKVIKGVVIDSRKVDADYLFIPIKGERVDGHDFIETVFEKGAALVLSEHTLQNPKGPYILVESTLQAMKKLAAFYRESLDIKVVGITGSVGKTSTKEMVASVLSTKYQVHKTEGNFNNEIGLPLTIFQIRQEHQVAVLEMGISDFGEMSRLAAMAQPDYCIITNIGLCHLEQLKDRDGILRAKTECFEYMKADGVAILNGDDDKLATVSFENKAGLCFYGIQREEEQDLNLEVYASNICNQGVEGITATIHVGREAFPVTIHIPGEHNVYNALAATSVASLMGLSKEQIREGIENAKTISGRTNFIRVNDYTIIDDCYNANPVSMRSAIDVLEKSNGRKIAVLGDMGELGADEKQLHYQVGEYLASKEITILMCTGELALEYKKAVEQAGGCKVYYYENMDSLKESIKDIVQPNDTILIKASHFMGFSELVEALKE